MSDLRELVDISRAIIRLCVSIASRHPHVTKEGRERPTPVINFLFYRPSAASGICTLEKAVRKVIDAVAGRRLPRRPTRSIVRPCRSRSISARRGNFPSRAGSRLGIVRDLTFETRLRFGTIATNDALHFVLPSLCFPVALRVSSKL